MKGLKICVFVLVITVLGCVFPVGKVYADISHEQKVAEAREAIYAFDYVNATNSQIEVFWDRYGEYVGEAVGWGNIPSVWGPGYQERADRYWTYLQTKKAVADADYLWRQNMVSLKDVETERGIVSQHMTDTSRVYYANGYYGSAYPSGKDHDAILNLRDTSGVDGGVEKDGLFDMVLELFGKLLFFLAKCFDDLMSKGGMALDNIIFGRVGGYGTKVYDGNSNPIVSFFAFELTTGNPYGVVAAVLYQKVRGYMYIAMVLYCAIRLVKSGMKNDYDKIKIDRQDFIENAALSFMLVVFMPYFFDLYLFVRDTLLKGVAIGTLEDLFGTTGFLESFRENAADYELVPCILYLGAVCASLLFAAIYIAYAMSMTIHFVLFPVVCVRAIGNKNALSEWVSEAVGLTMMPIVDGMLLMIPLTFSALGKGVMVMQLLSLVACAMLLTARKQARRTLGIRDNNMLEMGALASVMGAGQLVKGISNGVRRSVGRFVAGRKASDADYEMSDYYGAMAKGESANGEVANGGGEQSINAPVGMSDGVPTYQDARVTMASNAVAEKFANVDNFENSAFKGQLSNERLSELYKQRARKNMRKAEFGGLGAFAGGVVGGTVGFGAGLFMGSGMQSFLTGTGVDVGSNLGGMLGDYVANNQSYESRVIQGASVGEGKGISSTEASKEELLRREIERAAGEVEGNEQEIVVHNGQSNVATPQRSKEQMQQEFEVYRTHQFLYKEDGGKNGVDYANAVSNAGCIAEEQFSVKFKEREADAMNGKLQASWDRYSRGEISAEEHIKGIEKLEKEVYQQKERVLRAAVMDQLDNRTDITFDKNNAIHKRAAGLAYTSAYKTFSEPHRLFSEEYTKEQLGVDFAKYKV